MKFILPILGIGSWIVFIRELFWGDSWRIAIGCLTINVIIAFTFQDQQRRI